MYQHHLRKIIFAIASLCVALPSSAAILYDEDLTNGVVFGSGNANGGFTIDRASGIELALRAKLRFDENNEPQNIFNSNGDGTYSFDNLAPPSGFSWAPGSVFSAIWNFEWSIDTAFSGAAQTLDDFTFLFEIDYDPGFETLFLAFDPTATPNDNAGSSTVAQNSWNMEFFDQFVTPNPYTNTANGVFDFRLTAFNDQGEELASTQIRVVQGDISQVSAPSTVAILLSALLLTMLRSRKLNKVVQ